MRFKGSGPPPNSASMAIELHMCTKRRKEESKKKKKKRKEKKGCHK
jgi:hypothetical protein